MTILEMFLVYQWVLRSMFISMRKERFAWCVWISRETINVLAIHYGTQDYRLMLGVFSLNHNGVQLVSFIFLENHLNIRVNKISLIVSSKSFSWKLFSARWINRQATCSYICSAESTSNIDSYEKRCIYLHRLDNRRKFKFEFAFCLFFLKVLIILFFFVRHFPISMRQFSEVVFADNVCYFSVMFKV